MNKRHDEFEFDRSLGVGYAFEQVLQIHGNSNEAQINRMTIAIFDERCNDGEGCNT